MPEWRRLREALRRGDAQAEKLAQIRAVDGWLELPALEARANLERECRAGDGARARSIHDALQVIWSKLHRDPGVPPDEAKLARFAELAGCLQQQYPDIAKAIPPEEARVTALREEQGRIFERWENAQTQFAPETATAEQLDRIDGIAKELHDLIAKTPAELPAIRDWYATLAHVVLSAATVCQWLGRNEEAAARYVEAARWFEQAGDQRNAEDCQGRAAEMARRRAGDVDSATRQHLGTLVREEKNYDPWARIRALTGLADTLRSAGDAFEAARQARAARVELVQLSFRDPLTDGVDRALDSWIETASAQASGTGFLALLADVWGAYNSVIGALAIAGEKTGAEGADESDRVLFELNRSFSQVTAEVQADGDELNREMAEWFGDPAPAAASAEASGDGRRALEARRFQESLNRFTDEYGRRVAAGAAVDDLPAATDDLEAQAAALGNYLFVAQARIAKAQVLQALGRPAELLEASEGARQAILAGRPPALSSFAAAHERDNYLLAVTLKTHALLMLGDFAGLLDTCHEMMRDVESQRYRVSSPYQQSSLLAAVAEFYTWAAFAALKLKRWDEMLEAVELNKARSAVRGKLVAPSNDLAEEELARDFRDTSSALAEKLRAGVKKEADALGERRRRLADLLAIARTGGRSPAELPEISFANVQMALSADEAAISYFWLSPTVVLAIAVTRERFQAERILLEPEHLGWLDEYISALRGGHMGMQAPGLAASRLGPVLLPPFARGIMEGKRRLILSPHQALHLFPFQAVPEGDGFLGSRYALRYAPNLSSLLLPWEAGASNRTLAIGIDRFAVQDVPPLTRMIAQVARVQQIYAQRGIAVDVLRGEEATREGLYRLRDEAGRASYRCLHLATHGISVVAENSNQPMEAKLYLFDGALDAMDVSDLGFRAEVAVLGACNSRQRAIEGRGRDTVPGDEIFGLEWALFQSGVHSVVGSLWNLEEIAGDEIVEGFHENYADGFEADEALRRSVAGYLARVGGMARQPFFWAGLSVSSLGQKRGGNSGKAGESRNG